LVKEEKPIFPGNFGYRLVPVVSWLLSETGPSLQLSWVRMDLECVIC